MAFAVCLAFGICFCFLVRTRRLRITSPYTLTIDSLTRAQSTWFLVVPRTFAKFYTVGSLFLISRYLRCTTNTGHEPHDHQSSLTERWLVIVCVIVIPSLAAARSS
jgi:hypothetical protein